MKAAVVQAGGRTPVFADFDEPEPGPGEHIIHVRAGALSQLTRARASGAHYSATGSFPLVPGVDGVGTLDDGRLVYFVLPRAPFGAMAERTVVDERRMVTLPTGLDVIQTAAIANPGMSSWAALAERARMAPGETVLVNGATGASGRLAVEVARLFGAARVIATGRNRAALAELGADAVIPLTEDGDALEAAFRHQFALGVDVVLDYLWGASAERLLVAAAKAGPEGRRLRFVQIGSVAGAEIRLPAAVLRSSAVEMMGSGLGSVPLPRLLAAVAGVFGAAANGGFRLPATPVPLADVERTWDAPDGGRIVFTIPDPA